MADTGQMPVMAERGKAGLISWELDVLYVRRS
jgi:hypothetical protein